jgi:hypothetical protein
VPIVDVDLRAVESWDDLHDAFADSFGFPSFYGRNMGAWIDCLTGADDDAGLRSIVVEPAEVLTLNLIGAAALRDRYPDIHASAIDCAAFVNWRRIEVGERPILAISYR